MKLNTYIDMKVREMRSRYNASLYYKLHARPIKLDRLTNDLNRNLMQNIGDQIDVYLLQHHET
jgi:hypothetical protein